MVVRYFILAFCFFHLLACRQEASGPAQPDLKANDLVGKWSMHEAYKGKVKTKLLDNGFFEFSNDGKLMTNILGDDGFHPYTLSNNEIKVTDGEGAIYKVIEKTQDTLTLMTRIRNFDFKFVTIQSKAKND